MQYMQDETSPLTSIFLATKVITISVARLYVLAKSIYTPFKKQAFIKGKCTPSDSYKYLVHLKAYLFSSQT